MTLYKIPKPSSQNPWQRVIEDACILACIDFYPDDPKRSLMNLLTWEVQTALDPRVSQAAAKLLATPPPVAVSQADGCAEEQFHGVTNEDASSIRLLDDFVRAGLSTHSLPKARTISELERCGDCDGCA